MATAIALKEPTNPLLDTLLTNVAHKIQLAPSQYAVAVDRYSIMEKWLQRDGSELAPYFKRLYPQGSMAIGATIASKLKNDEFDIDIIAELDLSPDVAPGDVLDALFNSLNGEEGSRYHGKVERRTRCVTVNYEDMHIDVTPSVLLPQRAERTSVIFHAHEDEPASNHQHIVANPWGFAQWFIENTPDVRMIVDAYVRKSSDPVPDQEAVRDKSQKLIALQLLKRWRNKRYDDRTGRSLPSIAIAYFVATAGTNAGGLFDELLLQATSMRDHFRALKAADEAVHVVNPTCDTDVLTDRWPANQSEQDVFLSDLVDLVSSLESLCDKPTMKDCSDVLSDLFGENVTNVVIKDFVAKYQAGAEGGTLQHDGRGLALGASGLILTETKSTATPIRRHTDYGQ